MPTSMDIVALRERLGLIIESAEQQEARFADTLAQVHPKFRLGATNLVHYIALRHTDIRDLQEELSFLGLSSLGRAEKNVMASLRTVKNVLDSLAAGQGYDPDAGRQEFLQCGKRLERHIGDILGDKPEARDVRVMVTLPKEAASDYHLVCNLLTTGTDIARINCSHDAEPEWLHMIENIRRATAETGRGCRILMDLAGPKIRAGDLLPGPGVIRIHPKRDALGNVAGARRVCFVPEDARWVPKKCAVIPVPRRCIESAEVGDLFRFVDARGRKRKLEVVCKNENGLRLECRKTAYVTSGTQLALIRSATAQASVFRVGELTPVEQPIILNVGDTLLLHRRSTPGEPAELDADGAVVKPAHISCRQPEVFGCVSVDDPIRLNDGKIEGMVVSVSDEELEIEITYAKATGSRLRADAGINFPKSDIALSGLTDTDKDNLRFVVQHADAVSLSFVRKPIDIMALQEELEKYPSHNIGIVAKVETVKAFNDLPRLLLVLMRHYPAAVMIARGDLAVECGWERLAEIQEEILWMCEAAELPVIWATQVLESAAKKGRPSRAEITDAAMSQRADCVMLNKGPHLLAAITMLDDILRRMQDHQHKKTPKLRKLSITNIQ